MKGSRTRSLVALGVVAVFSWVLGLSVALGLGDGRDVAKAQDEQPTEQWTLSLSGIPDSAGRGGYECQGCDGYFTGADGFAAAGKPLEPVTVRIYYGPSVFRFLEEDPEDRYIPDPTRGPPPRPSPTPLPSPTPVSSPTPTALPTPYGLLWEGRMDRVSSSQLLQTFASLDVAPPYLVHLTRNPSGYAVCPNTPHVLILEQADFDQARGSRPGRGRSMEVKWSFWSCPGAALGAELPLDLGIYSWLDLVRTSTGHNGSPTPTASATPTAMP